MELLIFCVALFLSMSILMETVGIWGRVLGAFNNEPTTGYSTHVRVATLGRFFILISAPSLGYLVDQNINARNIALIGVIAFIIVFLLIILFINYGIEGFNFVYKLLNRKKDINVIDKKLIKFEKINMKFFTLVFLSFILTATGVIVVNYLATIYNEQRAMIVQMASIITMFGTLIHIFTIDPKLSRSADQDKEELLRLTLSFLYSRALACLLLAVLFLILFIIN